MSRCWRYNTETCSFHASVVTTDGGKNQEDFFSAMGITGKNCEKYCLQLYKECHRQHKYFHHNKGNCTTTAMHLETFYILRKLETGFPQKLQANVMCSYCCYQHSHYIFHTLWHMKHGHFQPVFALWNYYTRQGIYTSEGIAVKHYCIKKH